MTGLKGFTQAEIDATIFIGNLLTNNLVKFGDLNPQAVINVGKAMEVFCSGVIPKIPGFLLEIKEQTQIDKPKLIKTKKNKGKGKK